MATMTITDPDQLAATRSANPNATIIVAPPGKHRHLHEPNERPRLIAFVVPSTTVRP